MLYKICMGESFAEAPDRVGIIQADSMLEAATKLREWVDNSDWGDYSRVNETSIVVLGTSAFVQYESAELDGDRGVDEFQITPISEEPFMFLIEDWPYVFNRIERHL